MYNKQEGKTSSQAGSAQGQKSGKEKRYNSRKKSRSRAHKRGLLGKGPMLDGGMQKGEKKQDPHWGKIKGPLSGKRAAAGAGRVL